MQALKKAGWKMVIVYPVAEDSEVVLAREYQEGHFHCRNTSQQGGQDLELRVSRDQVSHLYYLAISTDIIDQ